MNSQISLPKGQQILLGKPAKPLPQDLLERIRSLVVSIPEISEAHLPQCFIPSSMDNAAQVLFVVLVQGAAESHVADQLGRGLTEILPSGEHLDIIPLTSTSSLLPSVRDAGCSLSIPSRTIENKPWWKIW